MSWLKAFSKIAIGGANSAAMASMNAKYEAEMKAAKKSGAYVAAPGDGSDCSPCKAQGYLDDLRKTLAGG